MHSRKMLCMLLALAVCALMGGYGPPPPSVAADDLDKQLATQLPYAYRIAQQQYRAATQTVAANQYLHITHPGTGSWETVAASNWVSGFYPGSLWLLYEQTGDSVWRSAAETWTAGIAEQQASTTNNDLGFMFLPSFGHSYALTGDSADRKVMLRAAASYATRYNANVGAFKSWDWAKNHPFNVIVDNTVTLELLFWAAKNGGKPEWKDWALSHALTVANNHVRPDGSTYHVVDYNPATGALVGRWSHQGCSTNSTWSRGQAWAIYGLTLAYRETKDSHPQAAAHLLAAAQKAADWYVAHVPTTSGNSVPWWDFDDATCSVPGATYPKGQRDSSAAAVAAAGLLELSDYTGEQAKAQAYLRAAQQHLVDLTGPLYLSAGSSNQALLQHGTPNMPARANGTRTPIYDRGTSYGDYYLLEALRRYQARAERAGYPLNYALQSNRSNTTALNGATVTGDVYVLVPPRLEIKQVNFWLDSATGAPRTIELTPPFDFAGVTIGGALPFDTRSVGDGPHTIIAEVLRHDGVVVTAQARFVVANGSTATSATSTTTSATSTATSATSTTTSATSTATSATSTTTSATASPTVGGGPTPAAQLAVPLIMR